MERDEGRGPNAVKQAGHDDANANPGTGASGPGERGFRMESQVSGDEGEAAIEADRIRAAMEADPEANDPAAPFLAG